MELKQRRLGVAWWCGKTAAGGSAGREKAEDGGPVRQQRDGGAREEQRQDAARRRPQVREEVGHAAHGGGGEIRARGSVPGAGMEGGAPARRGRRLDAAPATGRDAGDSGRGVKKMTRGRGAGVGLQLRRRRPDAALGGEGRHVAMAGRRWLRAHEEKGGRASQALGVELAREALRLEELGNRARGLLPGVLRVW